MKLSDYVIDFLAKRGTTHAFGISGGAAVHLFESVARNPNMDYICSQHEQSAAISADGYSRSTGRMGVAITTSGPGATNLLTGVCCSYYDSVPTLMLTGQVATHRLKGDRPVRQVGFQETDVLSIYSTVTKYAAQIRDPNVTRYELEKAWYMATEGRPGPVLIDIPDDLQRANVEHGTMRSFSIPHDASAFPLENAIEELLGLLQQSRRPVLVLGGGLATPRLDVDLEKIVAALGAPVALSWAGLDQLQHANPLRVGPFGVYGPRLGNYAVQNADLLVCLGTRLSQNLTGGILPSFARAAKIAMVDASPGEMDKFDGRGIDVHLRVHARLNDFFARLLPRLAEYRAPGYEEWHKKIAHWRNTLPTDRPRRPKDSAGFVDAYDFIDALSDSVPTGEDVFVDTGGNLTWTCNGFRVKPGQKVLSAWNNTPMGYALPAAIGASVFNRTKPVTCIIGDGGLMLCLGELATLVKHRLPIRVVLFNNHGHGIQKQTLETWLGGHYVGVHPDSGLAFTDFPKIAAAMGFKVVSITSSANISRQLRKAYSYEGPIFVNVEINRDQKLYPVVKFGFPLEEQLPPMDPDTIEREMVVGRYEPKSSSSSHVETAGV